MPDWAIIAIIVAAVVVMLIFKRKTKQKVGWKAMNLFAKRPHWQERGGRTDETQSIDLNVGALDIMQNALLNKHIRERDVQAVAKILEEDAGYPHAKAIDEAERVTGVEWK